jgi:hypothetical protein
MKDNLKKVPHRRSRRFVRRGRANTFFFLFRRFYKIKFYKYLIWLNKARKHFEYHMFFYISKNFLQLNPTKITALPLYTWYKNKYYNQSEFYGKYLTVQDSFYWITFLKKYFLQWKKIQNNKINWYGGVNYLVFLEKNSLKESSTEDKLTEINEFFINSLEIKDVNYLNYSFETEDDLDLTTKISFNFFENLEKHFFLFYYKILIILFLNKILSIKFF